MAEPEKPQIGERWRYKPNRGAGTFTVVQTGSRRVTLRAGWNGRAKTISLRTLRGDYERTK